MRRQLGTLMFAGLIGVAAAPLGASPAANDVRESTASAPVAVQRVNLPTTGIRDEAAMVLVGTALIGLAAAVRRAA